jgi:hypothetical protein
LVFGGATQVNARSVIDRSAAVLLQPHLYFTCDDDFMDFGDGSVYVVIMAILAALLAIVIGNEGSPYLSIGLVPALLIGPLAGVLATFVMAGIIQILCKAVGSQGDFGSSFHIAASTAVFMPISQLLSAFPLMLVSIGWTWWVVSRGVIYLHHVEPRKAEIAFALLYVSFLLVAAANQ